MFDIDCKIITNDCKNCTKFPPYFPINCSLYKIFMRLFHVYQSVSIEHSRIVCLIFMSTNINFPLLIYKIILTLLVASSPHSVASISSFNIYMLSPQCSL